MALARIRILSALAAIAAATSAQAGGLEANGYNWDLIFDPATYAAKSTATHVDIELNIENPPGTVVSTSADRVHYNLAVKADFTDAATCLVSAQNPFGSGTDRDPAYAGPRSLAVSQRLTSFDAGLTCAYGVGVGQGTASLIGGVSYQTLNYDAEVILPGPTPSSFAIDGSGTGWRLGAAYEIEEIALRVSAIYNAPVSYELTGPAFTGTPFAGDAMAEVTTPQSVELKAQTGIAPGWLALASVKWVDWSVLQTLSVDTGGLAGTLDNDLTYRDGWTVTGGIGHAITPELSVLGAITWDRGTSSVNDAGVLINGTQTDRWGATLGASYDISEAVELSGGISYSRLAGGSNLDGETWDDGSVLAISASLKASF